MEESRGEYTSLNCSRDLDGPDGVMVSKLD